MALELIMGSLSRLGNGIEVIARLVYRGLKPPATLNSPAGADRHALAGRLRVTGEFIPRRAGVRDRFPPRREFP